MALFDQEDYNGECFIVGSEGEREEVLAPHVVHYVEGSEPSLVASLGNQHLDTFYRVNVRALKLVPNDPGLTPGNVAKIAYLRMLCVRNRLYDAVNPPAAHNCRFSDYRVAAEDEIDEAKEDGKIDNDVNTHLTEKVRKNLRAKFTNMVCTVAYMFRVRGHHYMDEFNSRYCAVWRKCLYNEDDPGLPWVYIARHAFHAIYPDTLDKFWVDAANASRCSGTLIKRVSSAPAGIAGVSALRKGLQDLFMVFPQIQTRNQGALDHLIEIEDAITNNRWAGSINRRFYNAPQIQVDEGLLASLAASVLGALDVFATESPLINSNALRRIAQNAAITRGVIGKVLENAADHEDMIRAVLPSR